MAENLANIKCKMQYIKKLKMKIDMNINILFKNIISSKSFWYRQWL